MHVTLVGLFCQTQSNQSDHINKQWLKKNM